MHPLLLALADRAWSATCLPPSATTRLRLAVRRLPVPEEALTGRIAECAWHAAVVPPGGRVLEIGAGHDLLSAVWLAASAPCTVIALDRERWAVPRLVADTVRRVRARLGLPPDDELASARGGRFWTLLRERCGVDYRAPADARSWAPGAPVDAVVSTAVLEHVPADEVAALLSASVRVLVSGGRFSAIIDYRDHWSYRCGGRGVYDFLGDSGWRWRLLNGPRMHQNRLRHDDHRRLLEAAGLSIEREEVESPSAADLDALRALLPAASVAVIERFGIRVGRLRAVRS